MQVPTLKARNALVLAGGILSSISTVALIGWIGTLPENYRNGSAGAKHEQARPRTSNVALIRMSGSRSVTMACPDRVFSAVGCALYLFLPFFIGF
jgi:hypothetical protein